jgi:hypothetical protein
LKAATKLTIAGGLLLACALGAFAVGAVFFNDPVEPMTLVQGVMQDCVPQGTEKDIYQCTARLGDGSVQTLQMPRPVRKGAPVMFARRDRRFIGNHYQLSSIAG